MFECGLEGISLKLIKKSQYEHMESNNNNLIENKSILNNSNDNNQNIEENNQQQNSKSVTSTPHLNDAECNSSNGGGSGSNTAVPATKHHRKSVTLGADKAKSSEVTFEASANKPKENEDANVIKDNCVASKASGKDTKNVSSCIIEIKMVWFNFAAPPRAPITRKIDYTRYSVIFLLSFMLMSNFH